MKILLLSKLLLLTNIASAQVHNEKIQNENFTSSGVGGTYIQAINNMFQNVLEICNETNQYPHLVSNIIVFDAGTFTPVRASFTCHQYPKGIIP